MGKNNPLILLATRAIESPPQEGGLVMLKDLATELSDKGHNITMFSSSTQPGGSIKKLKVFAQNGWGRWARYQFLWGLYKKAGDFGVVHLAHVPTPISAKAIRKIVNKANGRGTKFVQTITGLPSMNPTNLNELLWGDVIVCQTETVQKMVEAIRPATTILPWPSPKRVIYNQDRRLNNRKKYLPADKNQLIVFPGEFERMGIGKDFAQFIDKLLADNPKVFLALACRFDTVGVGNFLATKYPGQVVSFGQVSDILGLMEAADLVIYPTRKIDSKFHPPLVIMESLQLGTPVLASSLTGLSEPSIEALETIEHDSSWEDFAAKATALLNKYPERTAGKYNQYFTNMVESYQQIYSDLSNIK